jgi:hypothetical protein
VVGQRRPDPGSDRGMLWEPPGLRRIVRLAR